MPSYKTSVVAAIAALATATSASRIAVNSWCQNEDVYVVVSRNGGCDTGVNGYCISDGDRAWTIRAGGDSVWFEDFRTDTSVSVKISRQNGPSGILQYEYALASGQFGGLYWDLSDLDGAGPSLSGTPFYHDNVKVTPTGNGVGSGTCNSIVCRRDAVCLDSYQHPDDVNTRFCPSDTGDMWVDLCYPDNMLKRNVALDGEVVAPRAATNGTVPEEHLLRIGNDYIRQFSHHTRQAESKLWRGAAKSYAAYEKKQNA